MEGSGSYGSGACAHLGAAREQAIEFSHPRTAGTSDGAKTDTLDARRAAREVLGRPDPAVPRARGRREALRALETTRRGAQTARTAGVDPLGGLAHHILHQHHRERRQTRHRSHHQQPLQSSPRPAAAPAAR